MLHRGAAALAAIIAVGLGLWLLSITPLASRGTGAEPVTAAMTGEGLGDAFNCETGQHADDPAVDIAFISVSAKPGGYEVHVRTALPSTEVFENAFSAAVVVTLGNQTGLAQIHADVSSNGLLNDQDNVIPGTENNVSIEADGVHINFPGPLKDGAVLLVETFHQKSSLDDVTCDSASSDDPTAPKATATETPPGTPSEPTATPTQGRTGKIALITEWYIADVSDRAGDRVPGFQVNLHEGDGCLPDSVIASGVTDEEGVVSFPNLPEGNYSASLKPRVGWNDGGGICEDIGFFLAPGESGFNITLPVTPHRNGDLNEDGVTNSLDALLVLQFTAGLISELPNAERADVNQDGVINSVDSALILQFDAGFLDSLPVGG